MQDNYVSSAPVCDVLILVFLSDCLVFVFILVPQPVRQRCDRMEPTGKSCLSLSASLTLGSMMSEISLSICEQGRIHQIEYAMEAVKQGSATVGLKSRTHAVLVALKVQSCSVWW